MIVIALGIILFAALFAYNLWHVYQPDGLCTTHYRWVELFIRLHLYHLTYMCL